jgi:RNA polymerase sigma-70 factor (ECF subfamily)
MRCHVLPDTQAMEPLDAHRKAIFGLCYRMTGSAADAEDLVQETWCRALERPPADRDAPIRPWLFTVATNLCIDALRKRKRERYFGPWLPSPVETDRLADVEPSAEARYSALESASAAFLLALEALDPKQRAVLILRDVLGLSGPEVAEVLAISPENVRVVLHRARKALEAYEAERNPPTEPTRSETRIALRRFMAAFAMGDFDALRQLLADDCRTITDGGGEYHAAVRVVRGREQVIELYKNVMRMNALPTWLEERDHNGLPAIAFERPADRRRAAPRLVVQVELDRAGRIAQVYSVLASRKLSAVTFKA